MPIKFQYNKTALNTLQKQLKMRQKALPTLQNKESALRLEVRKAKDKSEKLLPDLETGGTTTLPLCGTSSSRVWSRSWTSTS